MFWPLLDVSACFPDASEASYGAPDDHSHTLQPAVSMVLEAGMPGLTFSRTMLPSGGSPRSLTKRMSNFHALRSLSVRLPPTWWGLLGPCSWASDEDETPEVNWDRRETPGAHDCTGDVW